MISYMKVMFESIPSRSVASYAYSVKCILICYGFIDTIVVLIGRENQMISM